MTALRQRVWAARFHASIMPVLGAFAIAALLAAPANGQSDRIDMQEGVDAARAGDFKKALAEWLPLARAGNAAAAFDVAQLYRRGQGVAQDFDEAARWYRIAAERSHPAAQYNLAVLYTLGRGRPVDMAEARHWYRLAAAQGFAPAQYNLAVLHAGGKGGPVNFVRAWMWFELAAAEGHDLAARNRDLIAGKMTEAEIAAAKELVRRWREQRQKRKKESEG